MKQSIFKESVRLTQLTSMVITASILALASSFFGRVSLMDPQCHEPSVWHLAFDDFRGSLVMHLVQVSF